MPVYNYKFDKNATNNSITIKNGIHLTGQEPIGYKCSILDKPFETGKIDKQKSVTFRVVKS